MVEDFVVRRGIKKAKSATELLGVFQAFSSTLLYRYLVTYKIPDPPSGTVTFEPAELNFQMLTRLPSLIR